jgi:hypothetical protein
LANVVAAATGIGEAARLPSSQRQGPSAPGTPNLGPDQLPEMESDTCSPGGKGIEEGASEGALSISERADAISEGALSISERADARELLLAPSTTHEEGEASILGNTTHEEGEASKLGNSSSVRARQCSEETILSSEQPGNLFPQPSFASETSDYSHQVPDERASTTAPGERVPLWMLSASHKSMQVRDVDLRCRSEMTT